MKATVIESNIRHVSPVARQMRQADLMEIQAVGTSSPYQALWNGYHYSQPNGYTLMFDDKPVAMFGVGPKEDGDNRVGVIWLLGTDDITENPIHFLRISRKFLPTLMEPYDMVCNIVDARNKVHIKWMKWLGFKFIRKIKFGPENRDFWEFAEVNHV
jgi:hypothetical protein